MCKYTLFGKKSKKKETLINVHNLKQKLFTEFLVAYTNI